MDQTNIVLAGHICIDHNKSEHATYTGWGSSVLYMSEYYRKHSQARPVAISSYGPDILPYLPETDLIPATPGQPNTLIYENDSSTGKRTQRCRNLDSAIPPAITPAIAAAVQKADIIIVATLLPNYSAAYLHELLGHARSDSLKVLCPQGYFRHVTPDGRIEARDFTEAAEIVPAFDLLMYSEEDHPQAIELAQQWKQRATHTNIIVTQGKDGATIVGADTLVPVPTIPIPLEEIVDSVGCGDTFAATVTLEYYRTKDLVAAIQTAHKTAAAKLKAVIV